MTVSPDEFTVAKSGRPPRLLAVAAISLSTALLPGISAVGARAGAVLAPPPPAAAGDAAQQAPAAAPAAAASPTTPAQAAGPFPAQPPPVNRPGFIYAFGRWWDSGHSHFGDFAAQPKAAAKGAAQATQDAMQKAAEATKNAVNALIRLPGSRFIEIHELCTIAPNGAPDCRAAAANACRGKGFSGGHPVDVQSSENCPPKVWMSGREPAPGQCPEQTVVLLAACD